MKQGHGQAVAWMCGTLTAFTVMAVSGRELSAELNTFQILFFRSAASMIAVLAFLQVTSGWQRLRTDQFGAHVVRNVIHFGAQYGWFLGLALLPLAQVVVIEFTTPIWVCLFAIPMLGEVLTRWRVLAVALGFLGVLLILRPGADDAALNAGVVAVILASVGFALTNINTKKLVRRDPAICILFWMNVLQLPMGFIPSLPGWVWPSSAMWPWIVALGIAAMSAHFCFSKALSVAESGFVAPIEFLRLPLIGLVGYILYAETVDSWLLAGALLMLIGNMINIRKST